MKKESKNRRIGTFAVTSVLALCLALGGLLSLSACGGPSGKELKLEAEKAILEGTPQGGDFVVESEDEEGTSGWEYVGNLANAGNSVTWVFESEEATSFDITFKLANPLTGEMDLSSCIGVSVNGEDKTVSAKLAAKGAEGWTDVKVRADNIQEGYNFVKLTVKQNSAGAGGTVAAPNVDCIVMYSDAITAHSHKWTTTQTGGCVEEGVTHTTCSSCKYSYDVAGAPANGHTVGEDGKCEVCGELVYVYEAEYADMSGITSSYGATIDASSTASNGHSVGSFSVEGNTLVFNIDSTKAEDVTFVFRLASTKWAAGSSGGNAHIADTVLREAVRIELNDTDITPDATLPGNSSEYYFNWSTAVATAAVREGANVLKIVSITSEGAPNIDCVQMTTGDAVLTWENIDNIGDAGTSNESGEVFTEKPANSYANEYLLEAEEADFTAGAVKEDCLDASGSKYLGDAYNGAVVTFTFNAAEAGKGTLVFKMASTGASWKDGVAQEMLAYDLGSNTTLSFNGTAIDLAGLSLAGYPSANFYNWNYLTLPDLDFVAGENTVVLTVPCNWGGPNMDCLYVYTDVAQGEGTEEPDPEEPGDLSSGVEAEKPANEFENEYVLETEDALLSGGSVKDDNADASGGKYVGDLYNGASVTYTFNAAEAGKGTIVLKMASTGADWTADPVHMLAYNLGENTTLKINGADISLSGLELAGYPEQNFFNWNYLVVANVDLVAGANTVVLTVPCNWGGPNMDCLFVFTDVAEEVGTEEPDPEEPGTGTEEPDPEEPGTGTEEPDPEEPGTGTEEPDPEEPGTGTEEPDPEEPGTGTEEPDPEEPGTGTEEPDPEEPGTGTEEPDPEEPVITNDGVTIDGEKVVFEGTIPNYVITTDPENNSMNVTYADVKGGEYAHIKADISSLAGTKSVFSMKITNNGEVCVVIRVDVVAEQQVTANTNVCNLSAKQDGAEAPTDLEWGGSTFTIEAGATVLIEVTYDTSKTPVSLQFLIDSSNYQDTNVYSGDVTFSELAFSGEAYQPPQPAASASVSAEKPANEFANEFVVEAENASFTAGTVNEDNAEASGGKYVGGIANGASITFTFNAAQAGKGTLVLKMASTGADWGADPVHMVDYDLGENTKLSINGEEISLAGLALAGYPSVNYFNWNYLVLANADFVEGENTVTLTVPCTWGGPNIDCLYAFSDAELSTVSVG